jgi:YD repeat-containing protein
VAEADIYWLDTPDTVLVEAPGVLANDRSPAGGALTAALVSNPSHGTLSLNGTGGFSYTPDASFTEMDSFTYRTSAGGLTSNTATVTIRLNRPPAIISSPPTTGIEGQPYNYAVVASDPDAGDLLTYALISAPAGMTINPGTGYIEWTPTRAQASRHAVTVQVADGHGGSATQSYTIAVAEALPNAPITTSTPVTTATEGLLYQYDVEATDADNDPLTFSLVITPTGMTIDRATGLIRWTPSSTQAGSHRVGVRVSDGHGGTYTQWYTIAVAEAINNPPIITSNPATTATEGVPYQYAFRAFDADDDSLVARLPVWPDGMTFDPATAALVWTPDATQAGIHQVQLEVDDGRGGIARQTFTIDVAEAINNPPAFDSLPITAATAARPYQYGAHASDADGDLLTYSLASTPAGMSIRPATGLIEWTPGAAQLGNQAIAVQATDGRSPPVTQSFVIRVGTVADTTSPFVNLAITPSDIVVGQSVRFAVTASDNVGVTSLTLAVNGAALTLDPSGQASFMPPAAGSYTAAATARDAAGNFRTVTGVFVARDPADTTVPTARLTTPDDDTIVETVLSVVGTASDEHLVRYELSVTPLDSDTATVVASGTQPVVDGVLGHVDPTLLQNGMYRLRLTVMDTGGNTATDERVIQVQGQAKVGIFTLSFTDLEVPVAGLPIQVVRTYDSRDKRVGNFGVGWTLDLKTVRLHENRVLGGDWIGTRSGGVLSRMYCIQETRRHVVTVTLPDGKALQFQPTLSQPCQAFVPPQQIKLRFQAMPGTNATLATASDPWLFPDGANPGEFNLVTDIDDPTPYDPSQYVLILQDGRRLLIDQQAGLQSVRDLNGNELTFTRDGITHSSGKGVTFTRDGQGHVTQIVDPRGATIRYAYDAAGDLASVTDQVGNTTTFTYNRNHDLLTITDPRGVQPIRNEYDESGRLIGHTDADGNRIAYTHDLGARQESVQDRLGHVTIYGYDLEGNVVGQTDALGHTTSYTYDTFGNKLSETDPLGHTTSYTYDARDNLLTQTDPLGHTTSYTYNDHSQVLTTTDPLGRSTSNIYDPSGNLTETRDALGKVTR